MTRSDIDPEIRDLLRDCVNSYEKLDIVLLLWRRQVAIELDEIAQAIEMGSRVAREALLQLEASELLVQDPPGWFRYRPRLPANHAAVEGLARVFDEDPVLIVRWMSRNAFDRLHRSASSAFAEAVFIGKKKTE